MWTFFGNFAKDLSPAAWKVLKGGFDIDCFVWQNRKKHKILILTRFSLIIVTIVYLNSNTSMNLCHVFQ